MIDIILALIQFFLLLAAIAMILYMGYIMQSYKNTVPYVPTSRKTIKKMIEAAGIEKDDKVIDIGSGTGRIVFAVAKHHTGEVIGLEKSLLLYSVSRLRSPFNKTKGKVKFVRGDFTKYSLEGINVIMCFLTPEGILSIEKKLTKELPKGARVVSHMFPIENVENFKEAKIPLKENKKTDYLFVYNKLY
jgi:precorrin-6B methylase 2